METITHSQPQQPGCRIAIYVPGVCSLLMLGAAEAPFSVINQLSDEAQYQLSWYVPQSLQNLSATFPVSGEILSAEVSCDVLIIVSDSVPERPLTGTEKNNLLALVRQDNIRVIAAGAGPFWLAECGLLADQPVALHGAVMDEFSDSFPAIILSDHLYASKNNIITCAGQVALLDCLLDLIESREGHELAYAVSDQLCMDRIRSADERQRLADKHPGGELQPRLTMAIELMENNIEEPLSTGEIADLIHISRRQLERLFKRYLDTMPARYYMQLRLKKARQLLLTTNTSIVQIGLHCGFSSGAHFSSAYKSYFHVTPREERSKKFHDDRH